MRKAWRFRDLVTSEDYYLPVNPLTDNGSQAISKQTKYEAHASTYVSSLNQLRIDDVVIQDSPSEIERFSYEGTLYTQDQYEALLYWASKPYEWELRDDLGREFLIVVEEFTPRRSRSVHFPWKHTYTFAGVIIRELGV